MTRKQVPSRAEFKPKSDIGSCFEDVPAMAILAPLFAGSAEKYGRVRELTGSRGTGKTHLLRLLSMEGVPLQLNELDKDALQNGKVEYELIAKHPEPVAIVADDVHYLLKAMYVSRLKGGRLAEESVLDRLEEFKTLADITDTLLIFVADEGPAGLSMRFEKPENKKRFLRLMDRCAVTPDDLQTYYNTFGAVGLTAPHKTVNLDYRGLPQSYENVRLPTQLAPRIWPREFMMSVRNQNWWENPVQIDELTDKDRTTLEQTITHLEKNGICHNTYSCEFCGPAEKFMRNMNVKMQDCMKQAYDRLATALGMTDIPVTFLSLAVLYRRFETRHLNERIFYPFSKENRIENGLAYAAVGSIYREEHKTTSPIATIRELEVVAQACGGISRKTLGLEKIGYVGIAKNFDEMGNRRGMLYTGGDINLIRTRIKKRFNSAVQFDQRNQIDCFYYAQSDEELLAGLVEADLRRE